MHIDLPFVWALLIAVAVLAYVVLDGFDLGVGILYPALHDDHERDQAMNSVAPVWDGNETWLVLGGGGLLAVFPLAYAIILPALYVPIVAMLFGLILRGVAFEFRWKPERSRRVWDMAFTLGSFVAAFAQGVMLGALVQGIKVANRAYAGGWYDWLTPFSLTTGTALVVGYALLGACWLILKTDGELQQRAYDLALSLAYTLITGIAMVSLWTPALEPRYVARWFSWPATLYTAPVPLLTAFASWRLVASLKERHEREPFRAALALFVLCYAGLAISLFPSIVPPSVSIWEAAGPPESLGFLLVGASILLPLILAYTGYAYWIFRGKIDPHGGYH